MTQKSAIPERAQDKAAILERMQEFAVDDVNYRDSKTWSLVYHLDDEHTAFLKEAYGQYFSENGLNPMAFQSLKRMETDIINMTAELFHGGPETVGVVTSGGTESCLLPVLAYRDMARSRKVWLKRPEMIVPESVHVAWSKAAKYFGVKIRYAPLSADKRVDVKAVERMINCRTIMLVGSAPSYPHGVIDPIEELGQLALSHKLPLHVDACLGGFLLPFMEKNGEDVPPFDYRVPGVTSISADVHKYGFAAKGASTLTYRSMDMMKHQFFIHENWPGGIFASPALLGTRPGGAYAAAWAAMHAMGIEGYQDNARQIMEVTRQLQEGIREIQGLQVVSNPNMSVFAYESTDPQLNIFAVGDQMEARGWQIDRLQRPAALHMMVVPSHARIVQQYLSDLNAAVTDVRSDPKLASKGNAAMYGMIAQLPMRGMIKKEVSKMMEDLYAPEGSIPMSGESNPWYIGLLSRLLQKLRS